MSKLTISDLHFCDISLDASCEVKGGISFEEVKNRADILRDIYLPPDTSSSYIGSVITDGYITTSDLTGVSISESSPAA